MLGNDVGTVIKQERTRREWTVKELLEKLERKLDKRISAAYITRVEQYGEIPSPEFLCAIAEVLGLKEDELLEHARAAKVERFTENLEKKYKEAVVYYRQQRRAGG